MPAPEPGQRWGILGGAFDPIHFGHLTLANDIRHLRGLNGILFVPTFEPPHRPSRPRASFEDRIEMTRLAINNREGMAVSRIEEQTQRPSFTLNTVRALKSAFPDTEFELIVGADQLTTLSNWHRWRELLVEVPLIVGRRPGSAIDLSPELPAERIVILETSLIDLSSTQVRARIESGAPPEELTTMIPSAVVEYIEAKKLYR